MKRFVLIPLLVLCLAACAPQVTASPEATVTPPPTATIPPTPTLHPEFMALQELISSSGGRFTLRPDGMIEDGGQAIPGLKVDAKGGMTLAVDGEEVTLDPAQAQFDDETGFSYPGYILNEDGAWVEAITPERTEVGQATMTTLKELGVTVGTDGTVELKMDGNSVVCVEVETGREVCRDGIFHRQFVEDSARENAKNTGLAPKKGERVSPGAPTGAVVAYAVELVRQARQEYRSNYNGDDIITDGAGGFQIKMLSEDDKKWGVITLVNDKDPKAPKYFVYENQAGEVVIVRIQ
ncbi:MAG: hypothetical protein QY332_03255 [Anaerolineales bacterium]|nr:MAG: hypothetical protein QY332_03255 [Anaerolineales bacterium]